MADRSVVASLRLAAVSGLVCSLCGCSINVSALDATARRATQAEVAQDGYSSQSHPTGKGVWTLLEATLSRQTVRQISGWQVYPHVVVVDCASGAVTNFGSEPVLDKVDLGNANSVAVLLRAEPAKTHFRMSSLTFVRPGDFERPQCLAFDGGGYIGLKIVSQRVKIRVSGSLE